MAKLTKTDTKLHDEAMELINGTGVLNFDQIEFCYENYNPMAEHNVGKAAIFFTPPELAWNFAVMASPSGRVIDLCAGIGILARNVMQHDSYLGSTEAVPHGDITEMVCLEQNPEFVRIGKRLLPQATWIEGSVFDKDLIISLGEFDLAISNPPYGNIPGKKAGSWLKTKGPAQWMVMEVGLRLAYNGVVAILPRGDSDYDYQTVPLDITNPRPSYVRNFGGTTGKIENPNSQKYLGKHFHGVKAFPESICTLGFQDQWKGASPDVLIVHVDPEDGDFKRPYGFDDMLEQSAMF